MNTTRWALLLGCGFLLGSVLAMGCGGSGPAADDTTADSVATISSPPPAGETNDAPTSVPTSTSTTDTTVSVNNSKPGNDTPSGDKKGDDQPPPPPPPDTDGDGVADASDNCPAVVNADQADTNTNMIGDVCEGNDQDADGDGINNSSDNCVLVANANQANADLDGPGDACDNCPTVINNNQIDTVGGADGIGDACQWIVPGMILMDPEAGTIKPLNGVFGLYEVPVGENGNSTGLVVVGNSGFMADNFSNTPVWQETLFTLLLPVFGVVEDLLDTWATASADSSTPMLYYFIEKPNVIIELGGNTLFGTDIPAGVVLGTLWGTGETNIYAAGSLPQQDDNTQPCILRSTGQNQWTQVFPDANFPTDYGGLYSITTIWGSSADYILAAGSVGHMILFYNGSNWMAMETTLPVNASVIRLWGTASDNIYMVEAHPATGGLQYFIRRSTDGGVAWDTIHEQPYTQSSGKYPVDIWGRSATEVYIPMSDGSYLQWDGLALASKSFGKSFVPKRIFGDTQGVNMTVVGESDGQGVLLHYGTMNDNQ